MTAPTHIDSSLLRRYLLGQTSAEEQRMVEQRLLTDDDYFHQLLRAEEELTDEYAQQKLDGADRASFENYFLNNPERQENVRFAQAFNQYLSALAHPAPPDTIIVPRWRVAMEAVSLCAVVALLAIAGWLLRTNVQLQRQFEQSQAQIQQSQQRETELTRQLAQQREQLAILEQKLAGMTGATPQNESGLLSLVLLPGASRSGDHIATANLGPNVQRLRLKLKIESGIYRSYRAELQTVEGKTVRSQDELKPHAAYNGHAIEVVLPTSILTRSDYLIVLTGKTPTGGFENAGTYQFQVVRE